LALNGGEWVSSWPDHFISRERIEVPIEGERGRTPELAWMSWRQNKLMSLLNP